MSYTTMLSLSDIGEEEEEEDETRALENKRINTNHSCADRGQFDIEVCDDNYGNSINVDRHSKQILRRQFSPSAYSRCDRNCYKNKPQIDHCNGRCVNGFSCNCCSVDGIVNCERCENRISSSNSNNRHALEEIQTNGNNSCSNATTTNVENSSSVYCRCCKKCEYCCYCYINSSINNDNTSNCNSSRVTPLGDISGNHWHKGQNQQVIIHGCQHPSSNENITVCSNGRSNLNVNVERCGQNNNHLDLSVDLEQRSDVTDGDSSRQRDYKDKPAPSNDLFHNTSSVGVGGSNKRILYSNSHITTLSQTKNQIMDNADRNNCDYNGSPSRREEMKNDEEASLLLSSNQSEGLKTFLIECGSTASDLGCVRLGDDGANLHQSTSSTALPCANNCQIEGTECHMHKVSRIPSRLNENLTGAPSPTYSNQQRNSPQIKCDVIFPENCQFHTADNPPEVEVEDERSVGFYQRMVSVEEVKRGLTRRQIIQLSVMTGLGFLIVGGIILWLMSPVLF